MTNWEVLLIAVGLAMDAFAVAVTDGLCCRKLQLPQVTAISLTFGSMQGFMPLLGYLLGSHFASAIMAMDHYVALVVLGLIGGSMVLESLTKKPDAETSFTLTWGRLLGQGIGTSIDALAVGVSFAAIADFPIHRTVLEIAFVTAGISALGCWVGRRFGSIFGRRALLLGGGILITIGIKIFLQHMLSA